MHLEIEFDYLLPQNIPTLITAECEIEDEDAYQSIQMRDFALTIDPVNFQGKDFYKLQLAMNQEYKNIEKLCVLKLWELHEKRTSKDPLELNPDDFLDTSAL